jgi:glycosyltransferase involved in cell wall biosynthesis
MLQYVDRLFLLSVSVYGQLYYLIPAKVPVISLPVPSNLGGLAGELQARNLRKAIAKDYAVVIGTYGSFREAGQKQFLDELIRRFLSLRSEAMWLCMGRHSEEYVQSFRRRNPELAMRVQWSGELNELGISAHIQACDLLIQPYPNGVTTSRTSVMAGLYNCKPVVTTDGRKTEQIWRDQQGVALAPWPSADKALEIMVQLLDQPLERKALAERGHKLYQDRFSMERLCSILEQIPYLDRSEAQGSSPSVT